MSHKRNSITAERPVTEKEMREELSRTEIGRSMLAAHDDYVRRGGKLLGIEGIRRVVAENRGGLRDDEE